MIYIDYQGGAHGNYLEYVCNRFIANVQTQGLPFNQNGAAHNKQYKSAKHFRAWHFFEHSGITTEFNNQKIISIRIQPEDLLPLTSISLLRTGDLNIDNDLLEIDTFSKLNVNSSYRKILNEINDSYFVNALLGGYNDVKDPSWPEITSIDDFESLPVEIKEECANVFNIRPVQLSAESPDCPRHILREFFKIGFKNPEIQGFIVEQEKMKKYDNYNDMYIFPYSAFYDTERFLSEIDSIANWAGYDNLIVTQELVDLHNMFLSRQIYKNSKTEADKIFDRIIENENFILPKLTMLSESYLNARLETYYNKEAPFEQNVWFNTAEEIRKYFQ